MGRPSASAGRGAFLIRRDGRGPGRLPASARTLVEFDEAARGGKSIDLTVTARYISD